MIDVSTKATLDDHQKMLHSYQNKNHGYSCNICLVDPGPIGHCYLVE